MTLHDLLLKRSQNLIRAFCVFQNVGLYEYKLYSTLPDATPEQISAVFLDNEYRVVWDDYVTGERRLIRLHYADNLRLLPIFLIRLVSICTLAAN